MRRNIRSGSVISRPNPKAWLLLKGKRILFKARVAEGEERARLWAKAATAYPPYNAYQARAGSRQIPVVVLERLAT